MPPTTMLLTLFLIGVSGASPDGESPLPAQDQPPGVSAQAPEAAEAVRGPEGANFSAANHESTAALTHRTSNGDRPWGPVVRGALIGAILGGILGLLAGGAAGAVLDGVVRALP